MGSDEVNEIWEGMTLAKDTTAEEGCLG